jgi:hypothetical protein
MTIKRAEIIPYTLVCGVGRLTTWAVMILERICEHYSELVAQDKHNSSTEFLCLNRDLKKQKEIVSVR